MLERKSKSTRKLPRWQIVRLKATPAQFIGLVDAPDETSALSGSAESENSGEVSKLSKEERKDRARVFIRMVHLSHFEDHYIHQLSGGMKQRVALARSLALKPKILLMDEPFAALDAQTRDLLHDELERIWKETSPTIVFVTHNVREAVRLGDRVLLMSFRPGRIKSQFQVTLNRPRHVEDSDVAYLSKEILGQLREEIDRSFNAEYSREEKR